MVLPETSSRFLSWGSALPSKSSIKLRKTHTVQWFCYQTAVKIKDSKNAVEIKEFVTNFQKPCIFQAFYGPVEPPSSLHLHNLKYFVAPVEPTSAANQPLAHVNLDSLAHQRGFSINSRTDSTPDVPQIYKSGSDVIRPRDDLVELRKLLDDFGPLGNQCECV